MSKSGEECWTIARLKFKQTAAIHQTGNDLNKWNKPKLQTNKEHKCNCKSCILFHHVERLKMQWYGKYSLVLAQWLGWRLGIRGSWVQASLLGESIHQGVDSACHPSEVGKMSISLLGWPSHSSILRQSGDLSRIVLNSEGDCFGSTNALYRVWSQWTGWIW